MRQHNADIDTYVSSPLGKARLGNGLCRRIVDRLSARNTLKNEEERAKECSEVEQRS